MTQSAISGSPGRSTDLALAEILATRLCHDLAGALGTLMGALELAVEDPALVAEALPVAQEAAETLGQRLRFLRAAWGGLGEPMSMSALAQLAKGLPAGRRVRVVLDAIPPSRCYTPSAARLLLNMLLLGVESLGGEGEVALADGTGGDVILKITGARAAWPPGFALHLGDAAAAREAAGNAEARAVQAPLTALIAHESGLRMALLLGPLTTAAPPLVAALGEVVAGAEG